jgi:hypothetical protein
MYVGPGLTNPHQQRTLFICGPKADCYAIGEPRESPLAAVDQNKIDAVDTTLAQLMQMASITTN